MTKNANQTELELRRKIANDFELYADRFVRIRTKDGEIRTLKLNKVQKDLLQKIEAQLRTTGKVRVIILKARQQGLSTMVSALLYHALSHQRAKKGLVVAHVAKSTQSLFDMYRRIHGEMNKNFKPSTSYAGRTELFFDKLDTGLQVATAGGDGIARGETITHAHLSEVAFWPKNSASENFNALMQAIPAASNSMVFIESTANGVSGIFYETWQAAVAGTNGFIPFFSPWFHSDEYRIPGAVIPPGEETIEEVELRALGVDDEQLAWRRQRIGLNGRDAFMQEYPSNAEEAFLTSGQPIFNPELLTLQRHAAQPILRQEHYSPMGSWDESPRGELTFYREIDPASTYVLGCDVSQGTGKDFSVIQLLDEEKRQCAVWRGKVDPYRLAEIVNSLGYRFNEAKVIVENNSIGYATVTRLANEFNYPHLYYTISEGKLGTPETKTYGFRTSAQTKPLVIASLQQALRLGELELNDLQTISEMLTYIETAEGKMEAEAGCNDDCVMSLALAHHIHDGKALPISNDIIEQLYVRAI